MQQAVMGVVTGISPSVLLRRVCCLAAPSVVSLVPSCNVHSRSVTPRVAAWHLRCGVSHLPPSSCAHWSLSCPHGQPPSLSFNPQWTPGHRVYFHTSSQRPLSWREFVLSIRNFGGGAKALYQDMKLMKACMSEYGPLKITKSAPRETSAGKTTLLYPRKELQFMYRSRRDIKKMLPLLVLFMIPVFGYIAPLLALSYPEKLLTQHFLAPSQREKIQAALLEKKQQSFEAFLQLVMETRREDQAAEVISTMIEQITSKSDRRSEDAVSSALNLPSKHWEHLSRGWEVRRSALQGHLEYIFASDWLIHLEGGVKQLSREDLEAACLERGLYFDLGAGEAERAEEMSKILDLWINVSTQYKECPSFLLVYLPLAQYWKS